MIGTVVGNYKIIDKIGEGGMGAVFKGVDLMLEREVAIKMLRPELAQQPSIVERFRTEAVTLAKLNHSNVATLHSFFRQDDDFFMVMEFVRGRTLDDVIRSQGAMQCARAIELFCMALEGIDHAHKMGIVHRDIKPANVMLTETGSIKVMDFGIARVLGTDRMTKAGHLIGTVEYMSPEQVRGEETDARSDIYSLGVLLYEMLTGRVPFNSTSEYELMRRQIEDAPEPPRTHAPHIPLPVEQAIMRSLAKKRDARYQSAAEFRSRLMDQKNTGAVTRPLFDTGSRTGGYAAPTTQGDPARASRPSHDAVKQTRLAEDGDQVQASAGRVIKGAQLTQADVAVAGTQAFGAPQSSAQTAPGQASFVSKLSSKHYAGAAVVFLVLIAAVVAGTFKLRGDAVTPAVTDPPPAASPSTEAENPSATPAQSDPAAVPAPGVQSPTTQPPISGAAPPSVAGSTSSGAVPGRPRNSAAPAPETSTSTPPVAEQATPPPAQPPPTQAQPAPKEEKPAVAVKPETENKPPDKKVEEQKKRGFFGKIKDAFSSDKKKEEKKKP
jgi:tRNA A-37 threonylcarbamoyl transferase component Bud32